MKKKGKSFRVTPEYLRYSKPETIYPKPPKWFKIVKIAILTFLCATVFFAIVAYVLHYYHVVSVHSF